MKTSVLIAVKFILALRRIVRDVRSRLDETLASHNHVLTFYFYRIENGQRERRRK